MFFSCIKINLSTDVTCLSLIRVCLFCVLPGRSVHFGNVTGVSQAGDVVLGTSEVRSQWLSVSASVEPDM